MFCTKACPAMITLALWSCLRPRIGRRRDFSLPWSHSNAVVGVPVGAVPRRWQQLLQHHRVHRRLIGSRSVSARTTSRPTQQSR
jgi:hypothetical protein